LDTPRRPPLIESMVAAAAADAKGMVSFSAGWFQQHQGKSTVTKHVHLVYLFVFIFFIFLCFYLFISWSYCLIVYRTEFMF
jgi:hypothetical protein